MENRTRERMRTLLVERDRAVALLAELELRIMTLHHQQLDLVCEIAEAEDRGDWILAARLRSAPAAAAPA